LLINFLGRADGDIQGVRSSREAEGVD